MEYPRPIGLYLFLFLFVSLALCGKGNDNLKTLDVETYTAVFSTAVDENYTSSPVHLFSASFPGFNGLGFNASLIDVFRSDAEAWFLERFGLDFSNCVYDALTGGKFCASTGALLIPLLYNASTYRIVSAGCNSQFCSKFAPDPSDKVYSTLVLVEYIVLFAPAIQPTYYGSYGGTTGVTGSQSDSMAYGYYRVNSPHVNNSVHFSTYMKSYYPNTANANDSSRLQERFLLYSPQFGPGAGQLEAYNPNTPVNGYYPIRVRANWIFPGSFAYPELNSWTPDTIHTLSVDS